MGDVILCQQPKRMAIWLWGIIRRDKRRGAVETIRDNIEQLLNMVSGIRNDPEAVALAAGAWADADVSAAGPRRSDGVRQSVR